MFILPVGPKPDWRHPPLVTLLLVLVNCVVFFGLQGEDGRRLTEAVAYYGKSGLADLELPRYEDFLAAAGRAGDARDMADMRKARALDPIVITLQRDRVFQAALRDGRIFEADHEDHDRWRLRRNEFERLWARQTTERFAFDTGDPHWRGIIGHMFLHGSLGHLLGNMMMLLAVGYIVEIRLGALRYLAFYLIGGLGAVGLFWLGESGAARLVGASGAISAVMGMYTALFGLRRVEFLYSVLFWFDIARAPAILLLPVWVGNELYQMWTLPYSRVAYLAHVGGLLSGAALVFLAARRARRALAEATPADAGDGRAAEIARAEALLRKLEFDRARDAFGRLARRHPDDLQCLSRYLELARRAPESADYQQAAALVFALSGTDPATVALQAETYGEYVRIARPIRLGAGRSLVLAERFALHHRPREAAQLVRALLRREGVEEERLAKLMFQVAKAFRGAGDTAVAADWGEELLRRYPDSAPAESIRVALSAGGGASPFGADGQAR